MPAAAQTSAAGPSRHSFTDAQVRAILAAAEAERAESKPPTGPDAHEVGARAFTNLLAFVGHTAVRGTPAAKGRSEQPPRDL